MLHGNTGSPQRSIPFIMLGHVLNMYHISLLKYYIEGMRKHVIMFNGQIPHRQWSSSGWHKMIRYICMVCNIITKYYMCAYICIHAYIYKYRYTTDILRDRAHTPTHIQALPRLFFLSSDSAHSMTSQAYVDTISESIIATYTSVQTKTYK